ncbi:MAG: 2-oxoacid:ferredoxin oxidoreductase subunit beta [Bacteroidales bacterium]|nr:2-oxoacid:ferredoxin oxidoreductase subunit beta [Bacteroidales bacterium]
MIYKAKDFQSENEIRWCPGCGDYAILNIVQKTMASLGIPKENFTVISGIGCSSRFPYYMSTYGFHSIHGRATAVASGVKIANPSLSVWVVTGDGDTMAIGGNHFIHTIRRNINLNIILFNNKIYGLTKGQYSPTSERGFISKTSPNGTIEDPFIPGQLVIGAGGTFFARTTDNNFKQGELVLKEAALHKGTSVVEVLQNCVIFNNGVHREISDPKYQEERQIFLQHGEPMLFGANRQKGLILDRGKLKVAELNKNGITINDILIHNAVTPEPYLHMALINMTLPDLPVAMGVIRKADAPVYETEMEMQIQRIRKTRKISNTDEMLHSGNIWKIQSNDTV